MRVVIDTNVFIHGMLSQHHDPVSQACRKIMKAVADEKIQLVVNPLTVQELIYVFSMEAAKMPKLYRQSIRALATFVAYAENGNLDALQFLNEHRIEIHDPESFVANILR